MKTPKLTQYFELAKTHHASDIFIVTGAQPSLKVNGDVAPIEGAPFMTPELTESYLVEILTEDQKKYFEEHLDLDFSYVDSSFGRYRVNAFVNKNGVGMIFRPIAEQAPQLADLHLPEVVSRFPSLKNGLVVITGTVGSGKSTTLAAIINEINKNRRAHVVTIEDPIEFLHESKKSLINQREVYAHTETFYSALRSALRQAVDVILIGEMRDPETLELALEAAETGVLVFATLHTSGAVKAIDRIIDMFPSHKQNQVRSSLSTSLKAVVWQDLLKRKDKQGRIVASEVLINNSAVSNMIRKEMTHQIPSAIEMGGADGMVTMEQSLKKLQEQGLL